MEVVAAHHHRRLVRRSRGHLCLRKVTIPTIISRAAWGAKPWRTDAHSVSMSERTHFLTHYHGGVPRYDQGDANAREIEGIHLANGWSGVGYNFIVGQDGAIREGRGWN